MATGDIDACLIYMAIGFAWGGGGRGLFVMHVILLMRIAQYRTILLLLLNLLYSENYFFSESVPFADPHPR